MNGDLSEQLQKMLADPRVLSREGFNCRALSPEDLPFVPRFAACDVSFISLRLILPPMARVVAPGSFLVTLVCNRLTQFT